MVERDRPARHVGGGREQPARRPGRTGGAGGRVVVETVIVPEMPGRHPGAGLQPVARPRRAHARRKEEAAFEQVPIVRTGHGFRRHAGAPSSASAAIGSRGMPVARTAAGVMAEMAINPPRKRRRARQTRIAAAADAPNAITSASRDGRALAPPRKMKEAAGASPDDPATSDMVSGRKLQPGRPCGPLCFGLAPLIGGGYLPCALRSEGFRPRPSAQRCVSRTN